MRSGTNTLVHLNGSGDQANGSARDPVLSADAHVLGFVSNATDLVASDTNGQPDVFARSLTTDRNVRASISADRTEANAASGPVALSEDERFIAFQSDATNLTNLAPEGSHIFVHDVVSGGTVQASVSGAGDGADLASLIVSVSWDGRYVVFESHAASLVASDTNGARDLFIAPNPLAQ